MSHYTGARADEVFVGNVPATQGVPAHLFWPSTARLGRRRWTLSGPLSGYLPLFIGRTEADAYDRIMMRRTFPNQRAGELSGLLDTRGS